MKDYEEKETAVQEEQAAGQEEKEYINGIPNSVLLAVLGGKLKPDDSMIGESEALAPSIAAKMSRAFGMDVSSVKVSRSEKMKGTGMKGMAQGNRVILSSDLDLNTLEGQEILGHELSHIHAQAQGVGMGHVGLLQDTSLERQADFEGMRAARGLSIFQDTMDMGMGMSYGFGMQGVEGIQPLTGGISASAAAPMQAALFKPWTWFGSKKEESAANNAPANNADNANVPAAQSGNVEELQAGGEKDSGIAIPAIDSPTLEQVNIWTAQEKYIKEQKASGGKVSKLSLSVLASEQKQKTTKEIFGGGNIDEKIKNFKAGKRALIEGKLQRAERLLNNKEMNEKLLSRFKKTTMALFEKCGTEDKESRALYIRYYKMVKRIEAALHIAPEENSGPSEQDKLMNEEPEQEEKKEEQELRQKPEVKKQEEKLEEQEEREEERPAEQHEQAPGGQAPAEENVPQEKEDGVDPALRELAPLAWRMPTGGEEKGPELGVHIKQQEKGKASEAGAIGINSHAFISLEWSKYSRVRGRNQRFRTTFGFYPAVSVAPIGGIAQGGLMAGRLFDDKSHDADVSRKYSINFRQLNAVARAASSYADGGYSLFQRNCTTFAADMANIAGVDTDGIFRQEEWTLGTVKRIGFLAARGVGLFLNKDSFNGLTEKRKGKKDLRYGVNRELVSQADVDRYTQTRQRGGVDAFGYSPSATGERMRRSRKGGLEGNVDFSTLVDGKELEKLGKERLRQTWMQLVAEQAMMSVKPLGDEAMKEMDDVFDLVDMIKEDYSVMTRSDAALDDRKAAHAEFSDNAPLIYRKLDAWFERYGYDNLLLEEFLSGLYGKVRYMDMSIMESLPGGFTKSGRGSSTTEKLASYFAGNGGKAVQDYANELAFGKTGSVIQQIEELENLNNKKKLSKAEKSRQKKLEIMSGNVHYYKSMLLDMVDERLESYEKNGVTQGDLDEAFVDLAPKKNDLASKKDNDASDPVFTASLEAGSTGEFDTFSEAMQLSSLRMLFGEEPVKDLQQDGGALAPWKSADFDKGSGKEMGGMIKGVHEVVKNLAADKKKEMKMLMRSLNSAPGFENATPFQLALKTLNTVEHLYVLPLLHENGEAGKIDTSDHSEKVSKLGAALASQQNATNGFSEEEYISQKKEFDAYSDEKFIEENEIDLDDSNLQISLTLPTQDVLDPLKKLAEEVQEGK